MGSWLQNLFRLHPSTLDMIKQISEHIVSNRYYMALKLAGKLIEYEQGGYQKCITTPLKNYQDVEKTTMSGRETEARVLTHQGCHKITGMSEKLA